MPASFLRYVNHVFKDLVRKNIVITYIDDLIVPSVDYEEGVSKLEQVLEVAKAAGLNINWKKCRFLERKVEFLGYEIAEGGNKPSPNTVSGVSSYPEPKSVEEVQRFLGMCGYFRKFVEGFALIAKPLSSLTKKNSVFIFGEKERVAWNHLKKVLCSGPVLRIFDSKAETELHTDASQDGYGAVLMQKSSEDNQFHPVYYISKQTTPAEKKYHSYELEMLAVIYACQKLRVYLLGLKVVSDCSATETTMKKQNVVPRIARWVAETLEFDRIAQVHACGTWMR